MEKNEERKNEEEIIGTDYEVWAFVYNWDEQATEFYSVAKCKTREEAEKISEEYIPPESYSSGTFVQRKLSRKSQFNNN